MRTPDGRFVPKAQAENALPVGSVTIRVRHKRGGVRRAFVKVAEPNAWRLRAHVVWESAHGPIPNGLLVHHIDEDKLNDSLDNLALETRSSHLSEHRAAFHDRCVTALVSARKERRWSTKSATKRVGRHPNGCDCPLHRAK